MAENSSNNSLPALTASSYPGMEIVVADNGSTDDSVAFLNAHYPGVKQIMNHTNLGFANGYNKALEQVNAKYYVLLNSDVEVTMHWLEPMVALMEKDSRIGACQPKLLAWHQKDSFEYAGGSGGWLDAFGYPFCRGRIFDVCEKDTGQYDDAVPVFWASGAALMIRAELYHQAGGFDGYFLHTRKKSISVGVFSVWAMKCMPVRLPWFIMWAGNFAERKCQKGVFEFQE